MICVTGLILNLVSPYSQKKYTIKSIGSFTYRFQGENLGVVNGDILDEKI
jgi:hypothetical protein